LFFRNFQANMFQVMLFSANDFDFLHGVIISQEMHQCQ
jgi:hypothetical protein